MAEEHGDDNLHGRSKGCNEFGIVLLYQQGRPEVYADNWQNAAGLHNRATLIFYLFCQIKIYLMKKNE
nr:hypothetical protein [uncultured Desulfobacter sp.]